MINIINRALNKLGEQQINSVHDNVKAAMLSKNIYEAILKAELSTYRWSFAIKRVFLSKLKQNPTFNYGNAYLLPFNCLRVLELGSWPKPIIADYIVDNNQIYTIEGGKILTDLASPLAIIYVSYVQDVSMFSELFSEVLACKLAIELAESLTGSASKKKDMWQEYHFALNRAKRWGAIQKMPQQIQDDTWIMARGI